MNVQPQTYRMPLSITLLMGFCFIFFVFFGLILFREMQDNIYVIYCFSPLLVSSLFCVVSSLYYVSVTDSNVSSNYFFRSNSLKWDEIKLIRAKGDGFVLSDENRKKNVLISPYLKNYSQLAKIINDKKPDLWREQNIKTFHYGAVKGVFVGISGILISMIAIAGGIVDIWGTTSFQMFFVLFMCGLGILFIALLKPRKLLFNNDNIVVQYILGEKIINSDDVLSFSVDELLTQNGTIYIFRVKLKMGKEYKFHKPREGYIALAIAFQEWSNNYKVKTLN